MEHIFKYEPLQKIITSPNINNSKLSMIKTETKKDNVCVLQRFLVQQIQCYMMKLRKKKHLYKTEIQKVNTNSQRKYSTVHLEKEQMPTKEEEFFF